ncbi:hypothetical protein OKA05_00970 [Luteolibacter arcticus]|uniref:Integral membrane protein n=1 Tax=Luteolibacter arcticus TaxID=1581411 RepID=A0ABT3GCH0_9BACT|nr:hypothetical protein [Luteolibacter arcticus]MCW1921103.1 hypothetical protein [Luteolibacter arcticus]
MRILIFIGGILIALLGLVVFQQTKDPTLLQGGLTLGGGLVICGIFSIKAKWHGIVGAAVLALLGAVRTLPELGAEPRWFHAAAAVICVVVLVAAARCLLAERTRRSVEILRNDEKSPPQ